MNLTRKLRRHARRLVHRRQRLCGSDFTLHDLEDVDSRYLQMHRLHAEAHRGLVAELGGRGFRTALEVACGSGWNQPFFVQAGLLYHGLDVSETAVAVAALRHPESLYLNLGIRDCALFRDGCFDVVYSSSMLEHIGYAEEALREMLRLARREVVVLFFEGLSEGGEHQVEFHPQEPGDGHLLWRPSRTDPSRVERNPYGFKMVLQDQGPGNPPGWYFNRYSRQKLLASLAGWPCQAKVLGRGDRPYLREESVLVLSKAP